MRFEPCDCGREGCFRCAVGFVIASLGFAVDCECFSGSGKRCGNRCGNMFPDWLSAFGRCEAPYTELAEARLASHGLKTTQVINLSDHAERRDAEHDVGPKEDSAGEGIFVLMEQDPYAAAEELAPEIDLDPISFDAAMILVGNLILEGKPVPAMLRELSVKVLRGEAVRPRKRSKPSGSTLARDKLIVHLLDGLINATGLKATSASHEAGFSACNAVAHAFSLLGLSPSSYEGIRKIWDKRRSLMGVDIR